MGKKMAGTNEFAFFRCKSICTGGGGSRIRPKKKFEKCLPAGTGTKIYFWKKGKDPHPQDKIQHLDLTKDPRPLYYKTPPCVIYHKNVCSKAVFGP